MVDKQAVIRAWRAGRAAELRAPNPYYGQGLLARMWMRGYKTMLADRLFRSPARQRFLAAQAGISLQEQLRRAADPDWFPGRRERS